MGIEPIMYRLSRFTSNAILWLAAAIIPFQPGSSELCSCTGHARPVAPPTESAQGRYGYPDASRCCSGSRHGESNRPGASRAAATSRACDCPGGCCREKGDGSEAPRQAPLPHRGELPECLAHLSAPAAFPIPSGSSGGAGLPGQAFRAAPFGSALCVVLCRLTL